MRNPLCSREGLAVVFFVFSMDGAGRSPNATCKVGSEGNLVWGLGCTGSPDFDWRVSSFGIASLMFGSGPMVSSDIDRSFGGVGLLVEM